MKGGVISDHFLCYDSKKDSLDTVAFFASSPHQKMLKCYVLWYALVILMTNY